MNNTNNKKLLILGCARHGKDTVASIFADLTGMTFCSSSWFVADKVIYPALKDKYNYISTEQCFLDRFNHREEWKNLIAEYNKNDKARLAKEILQVNDIYVGMRKVDEYEECLRQNIFNLIVYVTAEPRLKEDDPTMEITFDAKKHELVFNHLEYDLDFLKFQVKTLVKKYNLIG